MVGETYKYPNSSKRFKLASISDRGIYYFECGHWCTQYVFDDLINVRTGIQNYKNNQLQLFK